MKIKVEDASINHLVAKLSQNVDDLDTEINKMINIVDRIKVAWQGPDATKYVEAIESKYILGLRELENKLNNYTEHLKNIPEVYETLDDAYATRHIEV